MNLAWLHEGAAALSAAGEPALAQTDYAGRSAILVNRFHQGCSVKRIQNEMDDAEQPLESFMGSIPKAGPLSTAVSGESCGPLTR